MNGRLRKYKIKERLPLRKAEGKCGLHLSLVDAVYAGPHDLGAIGAEVQRKSDDRHPDGLHSHPSEEDIVEDHEDNHHRRALHHPDEYIGDEVGQPALRAAEKADEKCKHAAQKS